ncbi:tRNA acetyltransferase TAN1 [Candida viswanathii]|uniref:tRNA acetyltransferase TAN1 n=1 Tax=Candida viswanathii TaxID=5486 RepID=A0A367YIU5_9ASCO|nr:tRNA acetyltransferase TAN1 [Candida viswanathii]
MAKRSAEHSNKPAKKRFKNVAKLLDPNTSGIYVTCARRKESQCRQELMNLLSEKIPEYFDLSKADDEDDEEEPEEKKELSIEEKIQLELEELKESKDSKKEFLQPIDIDLECLVFIKTRKPVDSEVLVQNICAECFESGKKTTRYTQKLIPIMNTCSAGGEEPLEKVKEMAKGVLARHFHKEKDQKPVKFAVQVSRRNFNQLQSDQIIKTIAEAVGRDHGHSVDLKNYEKLIIVECYKNSIGMGVADNFLKYSKFNLQQIYDKQQDAKKK